MSKTTTTETTSTQTNERLVQAAKQDIEALFTALNSSNSGLKSTEVDVNRATYGSNKIDYHRNKSLWKAIFSAFMNPFTAILICLAIVSVFTDIIWASPGSKNYATVIIISCIITLSGTLRFVQERRSGNAADHLRDMVTTNVSVIRDGKEQEIALSDVVVGDLVNLSAGDMIPADMRIIEAKDLFITQSSLTGESEPVEKQARFTPEPDMEITEYQNLAFMGTNVVSGSAKGIILTCGTDTYFGKISKALLKKPVPTSFEKGVNSVSWLLIRFMLVMVPIVLFINGFTKGDWLGATLFAISIAVGLTPEMLPMIVTTCLAKGAVSMSKKKTIIKNLNSIQNLGSIDILCTDKTGTLTEGKVALQLHLDIDGNTSRSALEYAFLNSYYQTGLKNLMDVAIIDRTNEEILQDPQLNHLIHEYTKVDEIPFDFERRRMSVVVKKDNDESLLITKGAIEEMLDICTSADQKDTTIPLTEAVKQQVLDNVNELNDKGMRVVGIARKHDPQEVGSFTTKDESEMTLVGFLAFLDPPKESSTNAIQALHTYGVGIKILTGDNEKVTRYICNQVGVETTAVLLGHQIDQFDDQALAAQVEKVNVFAKLSPEQKARIVHTLRSNHIVGYMGDGINDAPAMKAADIGISVDTAVDIAKESADVILLEKNLLVLKDGIIEGRKTYANMIKYIKMTASSNFGNMFSVLIASAFLPFLPMAALHLILLNLIYDFSCTAIPWDNVDDEFLQTPRKWDASSIGKFMIWIGPTSSIFDITTYAILFFVICPMVTGGVPYHQLTNPTTIALFVATFQAGWFIESMWTQTLVIHMIRTAKIPFIQSHASFILTAFTSMGIVLLTLIPFTTIGKYMGFAPLPPIYFLYLLATVFTYMILVTVVKKMFIHRYGHWL